jgi:hypothetical protein
VFNLLTEISMQAINMKTGFSVRNALATMLGLCLVLASAGAMAGGSHGHGHGHDSRVQKGTIRCGGNHFVRLNGTAGQELHYVNYVFRNRSSKGNISVDRLVFFDATGNLLYDSQISGFPAFSNQVLGPGDQLLKPNQTGQLDVATFLPYLAPWQRPMQLEVRWSSRDRALPLSVDLIRLVNLMDPNTQAKGAETTRDSQDCDSLEDLD